MTATTIYLRFEDEAEALAALAPFGLVHDVVEGDPEIQTIGFVPTARPDGIRVDLALVGGDGVHRRQIGTTTVEDPDLGPIEEAVMEVVPGFHVDLLWSDGTPPDFGAARIEPQTPSQVFAV